MDDSPRSRSPSPGRPSSSKPYSRTTAVSEDSDDYEHLSKPQGASTSTSISHNADSEGLRERIRTPYNAATVSPSAVPKREDVSPAPPASVSETPSASTTVDKGKQKAKEEPEAAGTEAHENPFACHICLEVPPTDDAVLSKCGHLFCWSDLSAWLESNPPATSQCPVCKSQIKDIQEDVIPIYSGGGSSSKKQIDPRTKPRPKPRVVPAPPPPSATSRLGGWLGSGGPLGPYWDFGGPGAAAGPGGWTVQAGVFPFPGLSMGWTGGTRPVHIAGPAGMRMTMGPAAAAGMGHGAILTPEMQEAARRQQRNALIAFVVMIILFSLLATVGEMDDDYY